MGTISKALDLLTHFSLERAQIGLAEFVRLTGRDKATVHRHLTELLDNGFLEQHVETRAYRLGPAVLRLASLREALFPARKILQPVVAELSEATGELAHASLLQGDFMSPVAQSDPRQHGVQVHFDPAEMLPLHGTSSGLAALAFCSDERRRAALARPLASITPQTITDPAVLLARIEETRRYGVGIMAGGFDADVTSVGAPLFGDGGALVGSLAVAVPSVRASADNLRSIAHHLLAAADAASAALGGQFPTTLQRLPDTWGAVSISDEVTP